MKTYTLIFISLFTSFFSFQAKANNWDLFPFNQKSYYYFQMNGFESFESMGVYYMDYEEEVEEGVLQFPLRNYIESELFICYPPLIIDYYERSLLTDVFLKKSEKNAPYAYIRNYHKSPNSGSIEPVKDTILFYQHASLGFSWKVNEKFAEGSDVSNSYLNITCISIGFEEVVEGVQDSIKTFQIQAFEENFPIETNFDGIQIKLSKNYGLINWFPFYDFFHSYQFNPITLAGFEDNEGNIQGERTPRNSDFFPYSVGDYMKRTFVNESDNTTEITEYDFIEIINEPENLFTAKVNKKITQFVVETVNGTKDTTEITVTEENDQLFGYQVLQNHIDFAVFNLGFILGDTSGNGNYFEANHQGLKLQKVLSGNCLPAYELIVKNIPCFMYGENGEEGYCEYNCVGQDFPFINYQDVHYTTHLGLTERHSNYYSWPADQTHSSLTEAQIGGCYFTDIERNNRFPLQILLHPNPTNKHFSIQIENTQHSSLQLKITDIHGQTILQETFFPPSIEVDLSNYASGIYLVKISDGKNWWTEKVVKY